MSPMFMQHFLPSELVLVNFERCIEHVLPRYIEFLLIVRELIDVPVYRTCLFAEEGRTYLFLYMGMPYCSGKVYVKLNIFKLEDMFWVVTLYDEFVFN